VKFIYNSLIKIKNYLPQQTHPNIETKILTDLTSEQKRIASMFFYDKAGSQLFEQITNLPEYYLTQTEIQLLKKAASVISNRFRDVDVVEFGSGDCTKISILFNAISKHDRKTIRYVPFDVSNAAVEKSSKLLIDAFPEMSIYGIVADFMTQLDVLPKKTHKIFCFLGSTIGNFSLDKAQEFLNSLSDIMHHGDLLLIGFDMIKKKSIIEQAYNDAQNITEKFNKNILNVVNSYIKTDFNPESFEHVAFYNESLSRIEMHLKAIEDVEIICPKLTSPILIKKGETIHTENSYKFSKEHIFSLAKNAQFDIEQLFTDNQEYFTLAQFIKN